jgi:shikimate dehydrogenase
MLDTYSGATRVIYIVGDPIAQVKSPAGVTAGLRARGFDAVVVPAQIATADYPIWIDVTTRMRNCLGIIVTIPHKFAARALCRDTSPRAASIGAVNIMRRDPSGAWYGDMCDGAAYVDGLRQLGCEPAGKRALLIGAGGAGSAIAHALVDAGVASLALHDVDGDRLNALERKLLAYGSVRITRGSSDPGGFDLVINATPIGMQADDPMPLQVDLLAPPMFVGDVITSPAVTPLIAAARARGCHTMTGVDMFEAARDRIVDFYVEA